MRIVFMGTPDFAVPSLEALYNAGYDVVAVFTQPDRPKGRGGKVTASPVKNLAQDLNLPVFQPARIKSPEAVEELRKLNPECIVVVAYGQILSQEILNMPPYGCVNVHASLLPAYRGAAPIHWAVLNGEKTTGITTMLMDEGLDTGDMLLTAKYTISSSATTGEVHDALAGLGAEVLLKTIKGLKDGTIRPIPQESEFTYAPLLHREHEQIDWSWDVSKIHNRIRGLNPWPGAYTTFREEQVKIWQSAKVQAGIDRPSGEFPTGTILAVSAKGFLVQAGDDLLEITELQPAGGKRMSALDFYNGRRIQTGESFS